MAREKLAKGAMDELGIGRMNRSLQTGGWGGYYCWMV